MTIEIVSEKKRDDEYTIFRFNVDGILSRVRLILDVNKARYHFAATGRRFDVVQYIERMYKDHIKNGYRINGSDIIY